MPEISSKNRFKAQSMVEFALVLPILLLIIMGVIAFGHLFFVYSSVVAASREASRWGAAVGAAPSSAPRYQDCTSIRAAAVRVGSLAGVTPASVTVDYDHGPRPAPAAPQVFDDCPLGGTGPSEAQVNRGDRIAVTVTVRYTPIVPLVPIPTFDLTATSARTIVKGVPVGDAPTAVSPCTVTMDVTDAPDPSLTGQPVNFDVVLTGSCTTPTGSVYYADSDGFSTGPVPVSGGRATFSGIIFETAGNKLISVRYESTSPLYTDTARNDITHVVNTAGTTLTIIDAIDPTVVNQDMVVTAQVAVNGPGAATKAGPVGGVVTINVPGLSSCNATIDATGAATCTFKPTAPNPNLVISANYAGDANFGPSSDTEPHRVIEATTPTYVLTTTRQPTQPATATPNPYCPRFASDVLSFTSPASTFYVNVVNNNSYSFEISKVTVSWPITGQTARLREIKFAAENGIAASCKNKNDARCIWMGGSLVNNEPLVVSSSTGAGNWVNQNPGIGKNSTLQLRLEFTADLSSGPYYLQVEFVDKNDSSHRCVTSPAIDYQR